MKVCDVFIEKSFLHNETLTYSCDGFCVEVGMRVVVHLRSRKMIGLVHKVYEKDVFDFVVRPIQHVMDEKPLLTDELLTLASWLSHRTLSPYIACIQAMLPNPLKPKSSSKKAQVQRMLKRGNLDVKLTPKQQILLDAFGDRDVLSVSEARQIYAQYRVLVAKGVLVETVVERKYHEKAVEMMMPDYTLSSTQQAVIDAISLDHPETYLIHGITGSGKTEVYLHLAQKVLDRGKQVLFLVPEISLTPQMIERVSRRFGEDIAIYHSALNDQEKYEQYQRILSGEVRLVVGTRSASFLPLDNLGALIMDEEHDSSYKQASTPYYHTRDVLQWRSLHHRCPLVLGSASPSLESYARALKGVYTLLELPSRINDSLPEVEVVDTHEALFHHENANLTNRLQTLIEETLEKKEQVMLLLNRRGYLTWVKDAHSNAVLMCPHCDVSLNYHARDKALKCHVCGYVTQAYPHNPDGSPVHLMGGGVGTQRLEAWLQKRFPAARILRMDHDTTRKKHAHEKILSAFNNHQADILIGTQMIAKGLDNPNVTLVGIINIDASLARQDYRSVENAFNLILQAAGRSGRGDKMGRVVVQTFNPNHYAIVYGSKHQYQAFFKQEMRYRSQAGYPPYRYLIALYFKDKDMFRAQHAAQCFYEYLLPFDGSIIGPYNSGKFNDIYEQRIILKGKDLDSMIHHLEKVLDLYRRNEKVGVSVDVNPLSIS